MATRTIHSCDWCKIDSPTDGCVGPAWKEINGELLCGTCVSELTKHVNAARMLCLDRHLYTPKREVLQDPFIASRTASVTSFTSPAIGPRPDVKIVTDASGDRTIESRPKPAASCGCDCYLCLGDVHERCCTNRCTVLLPLEGAKRR